MKIITKDEVDHWFSGHDIQTISPEHLLIPENLFRRNFHIPLCPRIQLSLFYSLVEWFKYSDALIWISVWQTIEKYDMESFMMITRNDEVNKNLFETPGYLFEESNSESRKLMLEILFLMANLNWEGYMISGRKDFIIWIADQVFEVATKQESDYIDLKIILDNLNIVQY